MSDQVINYPIFRIEVPAICITGIDTKDSCEVLKMVGVKALPESYISMTYFFNKAVEYKYPLAGFIIKKTLIENSDILLNFQDKEMAALDNCYLFSKSSCGTMLKPFIEGYELVSITDENREQVYSEFRENGFDYMTSQLARINNYMRFIGEKVDPDISISDVPKDPENDNPLYEAKANIINDKVKENYIEVQDVPQTWFEYSFSDFPVLSVAFEIINPVNDTLEYAS